MSAFHPCVIIPTFNNPLTVRAVVETVREYVPDIVLVDDGSDAPGRQAVAELGELGLAHAVHRESNGGKGAAVKTGFEEARRLGFSHALQVDADGQHSLEDIPRFLEQAQERPEALILGQPIFDETQPSGRAIARKISVFWVNFETAGPVIADPQCGFRVYPLEAAIAARARGNRMEFDLEIPVRMVWAGTPVVNLPTRVRYLTEEEGGISHFQLVRDNLRISWLHTRLCTTVVWRWLTRPFRRRRNA